ncbi:ladderlectin-like [Pygocentrus nattereri]|uniref:C-type lectin domain-containing protein n=1 Tax=Pygocentrus nattereri TaxID=42514 RepID=A0A3B4CDU6_PYGNA|nr:ladderlectin-like [Pygocentrus nattereri]
MVRVTQMSLLFVLVMVSSAFEKTNGQKNVFRPRCPVGWTKYNEHCIFYVSQALDWAAAEANCLVLGAHLVSIHSESEYRMVKALIHAHDPSDKPTWLGLSNCQKRDSWFWSDGSKFDYSKWNKEEPNHSNGECCVNLNWDNQKNWNDMPCNAAHPSVCSKKAA